MLPYPRHPMQPDPVVKAMQVPTLYGHFHDDAPVETDDQHGSAARLFAGHKPHPLAVRVREALIGKILGHEMNRKIRLVAMAAMDLVRITRPWQRINLFRQCR